ncbi:hypothetical protein [Ochrobactrum sp. S1502_03]|uniref:hypothetical protein n=1 Tax=Ochrobactrum sp. S1502_03 TaxID=3108451 RepID=UPI0037C59A11
MTKNETSAYSRLRTKTLIDEVCDRLIDLCCETVRDELISGVNILRETAKANPQMLATHRANIIGTIQHDDSQLSVAAALEQYNRQWDQVRDLIEGSLH